jgi:CubicO group peptidase (beta-lactamase class C family)
LSRLFPDAEILGIDVPSQIIDYAREKHGRSNIKFLTVQEFQSDQAEKVRSAATKQAKEEGLSPRTPEYETRVADLVKEKLSPPKKTPAEYDAEITCDALGTAVHDGGMCATARDLTRFGAMLLAGGEAAGRRVVPARRLRESWMVAPDIRDAFARSASGPYLPGGWYRNKFWFVPRPHGDVLLCLGIHGQMLYVNPGTGTVAAKLSSWPDPQSPTMLHDTLRAFDRIGEALAGIPADDPKRRHGPPGVVAGLSRGRIGGTPR